MGYVWAIFTVVGWGWLAVVAFYLFARRRTLAVGAQNPAVPGEGSPARQPTE
jgi:hypothetical protein